MLGRETHPTSKLLNNMIRYYQAQTYTISIDATFPLDKSK